MALAYYGTVVTVALLIAHAGGTNLQMTVTNAARQEISQLFPGILEARLKNPLLAVPYIFVVNLLLGAVVHITIPGAFLFFLAPGMALFRAISWGIMYAPTTSLITTGVMLASPVMMLEGLGYILAVVPSTYLGISWLSPQKAFPDESLTRTEAFRRQLINSANAYALVALVLLVSAVAEVIVVQLAVILDLA
jgi:hypothetical protein